ncbi:MAG: transketolase C-terminal domain-containing protein, partial [Rhodothermales bacterium]|nr:transketolase C-terminal domain-containing protein [Rhodothermales bacterium]
GLGEDGPTHQAVEHFAALRAIPGLTVIRPADANETVEAWKVALRHNGPTALCLTRQKVPTFDRGALAAAEGLKRGAYVLYETSSSPDVILLATGSEVALVLDAASTLEGEGVSVRVVSMPSWELFADQPATYREQVLPRAVTRRVAVEAGVSQGWERFVGEDGAIIGLNRFGASAPGSEVMNRLGFNVENIVRIARGLLAG